MNDLGTALTPPVFTTRYRVIYGDTDAAGVVYNANYLRYFEIGRTEMMRAWALPYSAIEAMGCILPVTETYLRFKAPAVYDDLLTLAVSLVEVTRVACRFHYAITREAADGRAILLAKGFTRHACVNRQGKLTPFPETVLAQMTPLVENTTVGKSGLDFLSQSVNMIGLQRGVEQSGSSSGS